MNRHRKSRKKGGSKKAAQQRHFSKRCIERIGFIPSEEERRAAVEQIQKGLAKHIKRQSNRVSVFQMMLRGVKVNVVYDNQRKVLATVLFAEDSLLAPAKMCSFCGEEPAECMGTLCFKCDHLEGDRQ